MTGTWPVDPNGDMVPVLEASVEAAKMRHPSSINLTSADRCDGCGAGAAYMVEKPVADPADPFNTKLVATPYLLFCVHHWRKHFPKMVDEGWVVAGGNLDVIQEKP
ncbi:DUF7455 domain-containing protein [Streptomyces roseolus]|uniref:DUF7455 domain-containing protein n=1 Tax=Streptomyces roseolus TaxID=67358 RepID=UPI00199F2E93|nr:hypothetical protein [Streptomyces roseolus]GGR51289.1 hypothetical protein GCM10010282_50200 [Streptomyces roseolus]